MTGQSQRWYIHADLDAFFASVEQLDHPEYRSKPVIVGGLPGDRRSVVSTASYEAREYGVHSAMPVAKAYQLCPHGIFVHGRMSRYSELSYKIMRIFADFSPDIQQISIDEAFIDLTGTERLFGEPQKTAQKIKERVRGETGLTVSVGLAPTKYLAKIASGMSKPDGFFFIRPGTEEAFMLGLPLNKVWGIGSKTLEALNRAGLRTTRDIHEKSLDTLEFLYGKSTGEFLFNVVRGKETETFSTRHKSHSISAETTFPYDVSDFYIAETALLELAHGVMFRLLKEQAYSRTAFIKIRYDDFSTVSAQETCPHTITTLDSFFEVIRRLFEAKCERGRGIRLLGVGFANIEKTPRPEQQSLFEDNTKKKNDVERAILKLSQKHPEIKIHKARLLEGTETRTKILLAALLLSLLCPVQKPLYAQSQSEVESKGAGSLLPDTFPQTQTDEIPESLFNWSINDSNTVEFLASGYWQAEFSAPLSMTFGYGNAFSVATVVPAFRQEVDLSLWLLLNRQWYAEAEFSEEFSRNTFALGYRGNGYITHVRLANRGIEVPVSYSAAQFGYGLAGGDTQAPGLLVHAEDFLDNRWQGDFFVKYEAATSKEAVFYGKNSVTDTLLAPQDFLYGKTFVLPADALAKVSAVYVETASGTVRDSSGRRYKQLSSEEYLVVTSLNLLVLSDDAGAQKADGIVPSVLVTFLSDSDAADVISSLGSYTAPGTFLGAVQEFFSAGDEKIQLGWYACPLSATVDGRSALVLQSPLGFSPFLCASQYDCGIITSGEVQVISRSSEAVSSDYTAEVSADDFLFAQEDFFKENHLYASVRNMGYQDGSYLLPQVRFPFADTIPGAYLNRSWSFDTALRLRTFSAVSEITISKQAVPDSVQVFVNNIRDFGAGFDQKTGAVTLSVVPSEADKIRILYQEESDSLNDGAVAGGAGFRYQFLPNLTGDIFLSAKWPVSTDAQYADSAAAQNGFAALSTGISFTSEHFSVSDKSAVAIKSDNTTGIFRANEQQTGDSSQTYYLGASDGYTTKTVPVLASDFFSAPGLSASCDGTVRSHGGQTDSAVSGYRIPLSWDFSSLAENSTAWAAVDIRLSQGEKLPSSDALELALLPAFSSGSAGYAVYLQLGVHAEKEFSGEDSSRIPAWKLTGTEDASVTQKFDLDTPSWQTIRIRLDDTQRARLQSYHDARLIVVCEDYTSGSAPSGTLYAGPYEPLLQGASVTAGEGLAVSAAAFKNATDDYATRLYWVNESAAQEEDELYIRTASYFPAADFSAYKTVEIDLSLRAIESTSYDGGTNDDLLTLTLDSPSEEKSALTLVLYNQTEDLLVSDNFAWKTLTIAISENEVYIDGTKLPSEAYDLTVNPAVIPSRQEFTLNTHTARTLITEGEFCINSLFFKESSPYASAENYFFAQYRREWQDVRADVQLESLQTALMGTGYGTQNAQSVTAKAVGTVTAGRITFSGDAATAASSASTAKNGLSAAGYELKTDRPLLNVLSFSESYRFAPSDTALAKNTAIALDFSDVFFPIKLSAAAEGKSTPAQQAQKASGGLSLTVPLARNSVSYSVKGEASQKTTLTGRTDGLLPESFFGSWYDISRLQFSGGAEDASLRKILLKSELSGKMPALAGFSPSLAYELSGQHKAASLTTFSDAEAFSLKLPFTFTNSSAAFTATRKGGGLGQQASGGDYAGDADRLSQTQTTRWWFYTAFPFVDLFSPELPYSVAAAGGTSAFYSAKYELSWKRRNFNDLADLFVPSSTIFAVERDIRASDTTSDLRQIKATLTASPVNLFGRNGVRPVFGWYEQDELISSLTAAVKIPAAGLEAAVLKVSGYSQLLLYIAQNNTLKAGIDISVSTDESLSAKATFLWSRGATVSPLVALATFIAPRLSDFGFSTVRKDSVNLAVSKTSTSLRQEYEYQHTADIRFLKNYTVTAGFGGTFTDTRDSIMSLVLQLTVGAKMEF